MFKKTLRSFSIRQARLRRERFSTLNSQVALFQDLCTMDPSRYQRFLSVLKEELRLLVEGKVFGAKVRSRALFLAQEERPSKYFLRLESFKGRSKCITELERPDGSVARGRDSLLDTSRDFYKGLLSTEPVSRDFEEPFYSRVKKLSPEQSYLCDGLFTYEECLLALKGMKTGKSLGLDGLPKEFYVTFFHLFGRDFVQMVNDCVRAGELPLSMRSGVITLICKDASKKSSLNFWRPISLLNVDYKIVSKSLTNRLAKVLQFVIHEGQTCSVPGRSITDTLHLIRNMFNFVGGRDIRCGLVNFDQAKAFDRVSHEYLWRTLQVFGFGPDFVSRVKMLYTNVFSSVLVNGFLSDPFLVTRSVRQGCGLSPLLYVLCAEPLAHRLGMSPLIPHVS